MNATLLILRAAQLLLSRLLAKRFDSPAGTDESAPATSRLSGLLEDAQHERASDVHLAPDAG